LRNRRAARSEYRDGGGRLSEEELKRLLVAGLAGDPTAYQAFLRALAGHLRAFLRRRLASLPDDVEDLVQESLLAVHNQRHTYDASQLLTPWVYALARYKLVDFLRRRERRDLLTEPFDEDSELFATSDDEAAQARRDLAVLLESLPDRQRLPIVHVKIEGLSVAETARRTGMSESAVKVGVHRGLKALAARLRGSGAGKQGEGH
jgi:RNA polymerase sigma-70 factor, ECF subfamily